MGDNSPLAKIYNLNSVILLIGVGHESNTSLHLAEHRAEILPSIKQGGAILDNDKRKWVTFNELDYDVDSFSTIGKKFEQEHKFLSKKIGNSAVKLFSQTKLVDYATEWIKNHNNVF